MRGEPWAGSPTLILSLIQNSISDNLPFSARLLAEELKLPYLYILTRRNASRHIMMANFYLIIFALILDSKVCSVSEPKKDSPAM
jgi:hypothetical protein